MSFLDDLSSVLGHAQSNHPRRTENDDSLFNNAVSYLSENQSQLSDSNNYEIDEDRYVRAHQSLYAEGGEQQHDSQTVGAGAAIQAVKMFTSGEQGEGGGGGMDKNMLIGMAMSHAGQLWDQKNEEGSVSGDKQSAVNAAAEGAMKMYVKSQMGIGGTGGPGGLMGLASKFL